MKRLSPQSLNPSTRSLFMTHWCIYLLIWNDFRLPAVCFFSRNSAGYERRPFGLNENGTGGMHCLAFFLTRPPPYNQSCQPKKIKIWKIANVSFFDHHKVVQSRDHQISQKFSSEIQKTKRQNMSEKGILWLLFVLYGRFGDSYGRVGD